MRDRPRALVLTLYSGEQEFEASREALARQSFRDFDHRVFEHLGNREAHQALQRAVMESAADYDVFVKVDADMVFRRDDSLEAIVRCFRERPRLDHLRAVVHDWFSDSLVMGLHAWSSRVHWDESDEPLFVDTHAVFPGEELSLHGEPAPFVLHCPDPSPHQAFHFGLHRALKALQPGRGPFAFAYGLAMGQWKILRGTWRHFERTRDARLGLAVMGADLVLAGRVEAARISDKREDQRALFESVAELGADELAARLTPQWGTPFGASLRYALRIGPRSLVAAPLEVARTYVGGG